jgi:hypothetical protein
VAVHEKRQTALLQSSGEPIAAMRAGLPPGRGGVRRGGAVGRYGLAAAIAFPSVSSPPSASTAATAAVNGCERVACVWRMRIRAREQRWCMLHAYVRALMHGCVCLCTLVGAFMHACACVHVARGHSALGRWRWAAAARPNPHFGWRRRMCCTRRTRIVLRSMPSEPSSTRTRTPPRLNLDAGDAYRDGCPKSL